MENETMCKALHLLGVIQDFLRSPIIPLREDAKSQIRFRMEASSEENALEYLRNSYVTPDQPTLLVTVGINPVLVDWASGIQVDGIGFRWDEVLQYIKEMCGRGLYMTPTEEKSYQERLSAFQQKQADRLEGMLGSGNEETRVQAVQKFGPAAWERLVNDPSMLVRGGIAYFATDEYRIQLIDDPEPIVREMIAEHGGDSVHQAMIDRGEKKPEILSAIAKHGSVSTQIQMVHTYSSQPDILKTFSKDLGKAALFELLKSEDPHVAVLGISVANREHCVNLLQTPGLDVNDRFTIGVRLDELKGQDFDLSDPNL